MKRAEILEKLGFTTPDTRSKRVIILSDLKNEADDQFAVIHHLLTPSHDVRGIVACHFEWKARVAEENRRAIAMGKQPGPDANGCHDYPRYTSMEESYLEGIKLLRLAQMEDVLLLRGSDREITSRENLPNCPGADFIIQEALRDDPRPLYICMLGCATDIAIALLKEPRIGKKITVIWIGGGDYPKGGWEFNMNQDYEAARILFESDAAVWQVPMGVYKTMEVTFAELAVKVAPQGELGNYLFQQMLQLNKEVENMPGTWPHGESWSLGDSPTVSVLLQGMQRECWHDEKAPFVDDFGNYTPNPNGKIIRVYDHVDVRMTLEDMFSKLMLCYGK